MARSSYLKLWLLLFVGVLGFRLYFVHIAEAAQKHFSILVVLVVGALLYIFGAFANTPKRQGVTSSTLRSTLLASVTTAVGVATYVLYPELTATVAMGAWLLALIPGSEPGNA
ncbi:hypothetical protein KUV95_17265 [Microbulbifer agarilyticus]|uniref:hypothetical protein n=1 Tax=Microbulbifer agarilyticus TaxID=260552 RepID=UPI001C97F3E8|nr:hypothetical protein [Microbulbifer agarilyticus]MBY6213296.1 hypothetical protein [Microbulbifer agarilyticus]